MKKYKSDIVFWLVIIIALIGGYQLREVVLPFGLALLLAAGFAPLADLFQKLTKNRALAVSSALLSIIVAIASVLLLFTAEIIRDTNRLGNTFSQFAEVNSSEIDDSANWVKEQFDEYIQPLMNEGSIQLDSITNQGVSQLLENDSLVNQLNTDQLGAVYDLLFSGDEEVGEDEESDAGLSFIVVFFSAIGYFIYMIYTWGYFQSRLKLLTNQEKVGRIYETLKEVKKVFKTFFQQRGLIVLIYTGYFLLSFYLLGIPGALILGLLAGVLCFIPYLQYIMLIPIALLCVILNMEGDLGYFIYLGIAVVVFIIGTIVEELVLIPKIFKQENSLNPAVLMFALALFGETMGLFGIMLAVPFTIVAKSYLKKLLFIA